MSRVGEYFSMVVRQIIRNGGFDPEDVARLDAAFTAAWKQIECRYDLASDMERDATRERLAVMIVTLGKSCHEIDAVELQARALAMFDQNGWGPASASGSARDRAWHTCNPNPAQHISCLTLWGPTFRFARDPAAAG